MSLLLATKTVKKCFGLRALSRNDNLASGATSFCFSLSSGPLFPYFMSISYSTLIWSQKEFFISFLYRLEALRVERDFFTSFHEDFKALKRIFKYVKFFPKCPSKFGDPVKSLQKSPPQAHTRECSIYNWSNLEKNKFSIFFFLFYSWCERCTWIWQCHVNLIKLNKWRMTMTMNE